MLSAGQRGGNRQAYAGETQVCRMRRAGGLPTSSGRAVPCRAMFNPTPVWKLTCYRNTERLAAVPSSTDTALCHGGKKGAL